MVLPRWKTGDLKDAHPIERRVGVEVSDATSGVLTRAILGADTPDAFDLFSYFDGIPLSNACLAEEGILRADADLGALSGTLSRISPKSEDQAFLRDAVLELLDRNETNTLIVGKFF